jgi:hypothetical protein
MPTLRIDHEVHTYDRWEAALDGYADVPPRVFTTLGPAANPPPPPTASGQIRSSRPNRCPPTTSRRMRSAPEHSSQRSRIRIGGFWRSLQQEVADEFDRLHER